MSAVHMRGRIRCRFPDGQIAFHNTVLRSGRAALARGLAGGQMPQVVAMIFGDGGDANELPPDEFGIRPVDPGRTGLFGVTRLKLPVTVQWLDQDPPAVLVQAKHGFDEGNGVTLNEMGLLLDDGQLLAMSTYPGFSKTPDISLVWDWEIEFTA